MTFGTEYATNSNQKYNGILRIDDNSYISIIYDTNIGSYIARVVTVDYSTGDQTFGPNNIITTSLQFTCSLNWLDNTHFVIIGSSYSDYGYAQIGTLSGTTITVGTKFIFSSSYLKKSKVISLDSNHFVVAYYESSDEYGRLVAGTVSGSTISYNTPIVYLPVRDFMQTNFGLKKISTSEFILSYIDKTSGNNGAIRVCTYNGTNIILETEYIFEPSYNTYCHVLNQLDASTNRYIDHYFSDTGSYGIVINRNGNNFSFGTRTYISDKIYYSDGTELGDDVGILSYVDSGNTGYLYFLKYETNGNTISYDAKISPLTRQININASNGYYNPIHYITTSNWVIYYYDDDQHKTFTITGSLGLPPILEYDIISEYDISYILDKSSSYIFNHDINYYIDYENSYITTTSIDNNIIYNNNYSLDTLKGLVIDNDILYNIDYENSYITTTSIDNDMLYNIDYENSYYITYDIDNNMIYNYNSNIFVIGEGYVDINVDYDIDYVLYFPGIYIGKIVASNSNVNIKEVGVSNIRKKIKNISEFEQQINNNSKITINTTSSSRINKENNNDSSIK